MQNFEKWSKREEFLLPGNVIWNFLTLEPLGKKNNDQRPSVDIPGAFIAELRPCPYHVGVPYVSSQTAEF